MSKLNRVICTLLPVGMLIVTGCAGDDPSAADKGKNITPTKLAPLPGGPRPSGDGPDALVNKALPDFSMTDLKDQKLTNDSLKGKVLLIDFWATWCGPCRLVAPVLQKLHEKYADKGLVVIGANTSERGDKGKEPALAYVAEHKYAYTFTYGNDEFQNACSVSGLPTMIVVDRKGIVRKVQVGINPDLEAFQKFLEKEIEPLL